MDTTVSPSGTHAVPDDIAELQARPPRIPPFVTSLVVALVVAAITCGITWFLYTHAERELLGEVRTRLERLAALAASQVDGDLHDGMRGERRKDEPEYIAQNRFLLDLVKANPDIAYTYSAIELDGKVVLLLDTEPPDGPDDMGIVQPYEDAPEDLVTAIRQKRALMSSAPYTDEWGTFITAYHPFLNRAGQFSGVIGVDLRLEDYQNKLKPMFNGALVAMGVGVLLALVVGWGLAWMARRDSALAQLGRQMRNVNALLNVSRALGGNIGIDNLLPVIVSKTTTVMRAERSSLFLYDKAANVLRGKVTEGMEAGKELVVPADRGIAGRVARTGEIANVKDPHADPDFDSAFDKASGFNTRAILTVPVLSAKGQVLGVLQALNPTDNHPFDHDDETMLRALAAQAAVALEREQANLAVQQKRKLEDTLKFAQSIQLGMLPRRFPDAEATGIELFSKLIPAKMVGGDFYDFPWVDEHRIGLVMADVSGKGVPAALLMAKAMTMVRAYLSAAGDPAEALRRANEELSEDNDAAMFVTCFAAVYDTRNGQLTFSNAGHNHPYVIRGGQVVALNQACLTALGTQIGAEYVNARLQLKVQDVLYLFTDGVNEAMNLQYEEYGDARLEAFLAAHHGDTMTELADRCVESVRAHANGAEQSDDIAVLVMRVKGFRG